VFFSEAVDVSLNFLLDLLGHDRAVQQLCAPLSRLCFDIFSNQLKATTPDESEVLVQR
jgi:hypothetical protein